MADSTIQELTVEDPSEEFDKLRDRNDWNVLEPRFRAAGIKINTSFENVRLRRMPTAKLLPLDTLKSIRASTKIASRQFSRQLEMYLLSLIPFSHRAAGGASLTKLLIQKAKTPNPDDKSYYWWRMLLKQRITKKNKDFLQQMDLAERIPKVEESTRAQEDEYEGLLLSFAEAMARDVLQNGNGSSSKERKRKIVVDDDDDDEEDEDGNDSEPPASKKAKT